MPDHGHAYPRHVFSLLVAVWLVWAAPVSGQEPVNPAPASRIQIGPLHVDLGIEVKEVGMDSNVFNDSEEPQEDFTATVIRPENGVVRVQVHDHRGALVFDQQPRLRLVHRDHRVALQHHDDHGQKEARGRHQAVSEHHTEAIHDVRVVPRRRQLPKPRCRAGWRS